MDQQSIDVFQLFAGRVGGLEFDGAAFLSVGDADGNRFPDQFFLVPQFLHRVLVSEVGKTTGAPPVHGLIPFVLDMPPQCQCTAFPPPGSRNSSSRPAPADPGRPGNLHSADGTQGSADPASRPMFRVRVVRRRSLFLQITPGHADEYCRNGRQNQCHHDRVHDAEIFHDIDALEIPKGQKNRHENDGQREEKLIAECPFAHGQ